MYVNRVFFCSFQREEAVMIVLWVEHQCFSDTVAFIQGSPTKYATGKSFHEAIARFAIFFSEDLGLNVSRRGQNWYVSRRLGIAGKCKRIFSCNIPCNTGISVSEMYTLLGKLLFKNQRQLLLSIPEEGEGQKSSNVILFPIR